MMPEVLTIAEYDSISCESEEHSLPKSDFDALVEFVEHNHEEGRPDLLKVGIRAGVKGLAVTASNYVGVIQFRSGTSIEILPKISKDVSPDKSREIFLRMLEEVDDLGFEESGPANIDVSKSPILEVFISRFIAHVQDVVRRGLASAYYDVEGNERFLRGSVVFQQDVIQNSAHRERFYVRYQTYGLDRPENRLIKTALDMLYRLSRNARNRRDIQTLLTHFDNLPFSSDIESDIGRISLDRNLKHYSLALKWACIFLGNRSFNVFSGKDVAFAILFPMDKLFERYVYSILSKSTSDLEFTKQESSYLFKDKSGKDKVEIKPDIIVRRDGECKAILDTKWKRICKEGDVDQSDIYQMVAYSVKHGCRNMILVYPRVSGVSFVYTSDSADTQLRNYNLDLENPDITALISMIREG